MNIRNGLELLKEDRQKVYDKVLELIKEDKLNSVAFINKNSMQQLKESYNIKSLVSGLPIMIKDNILEKNSEITACSKMLKGFISPYDSTVVKKLKEKGMVIMASANMDEFAMGSSNENSNLGSVKNFWDETRTPGGSSGGSANAVASGIIPFALGTDTGGSVRQPASFTGVIGLKPTYGRVSRYGIIAFGSSLDQVGILANNAKDTALVLQTIAGYDPLDSTTSKVEVPNYLENINKSIKGLKIGLPKEYYEKLDVKIKENIFNAVKVLENMGAVVKEVSLKNINYSIPAYYIISSAEAASNLSRFDGVRYGYRSSSNNVEDMYFKTRTEGFGKEVKRRIMIGNYVLSSGFYDAYFKKASQIRRLIQDDFLKVLNEVDVILTPTSPTTAFKLNEKLSDPVKMYLADIYTVSVNLAGLPAISVPTGLVDGLPVSMQLISNFFREDLLLNITNVYEEKRGILCKNMK